MAKAKKLPSGNWRVRVYDYTDETGKKHYKSFTSKDKTEAEYMAAEFRRSRPDRNSGECGLLLSVAMTNYIDSREKILSPATIREYRRMCSKNFQELLQERVCDITQAKIQRAINKEAETHSAKSVKNMHGLISATMKVYRPEMVLYTTLPAKVKTETYIPTDADIQKLLKTVSGTDMELPVLLAAFGPLRRSEICALTRECVTEKHVHIRSAMVKDSDQQWIIKGTKTYAGDRKIVFPDFVMQKLLSCPPGRITDKYPDHITRKFSRVLKWAGLPHFRFHDLRHYGASILHAIGVPDQYIMSRGGWSSDGVLKTVYRHTLSDKQIEMTAKANSHFAGMMLEQSKIEQPVPAPEFDNLYTTGRTEGGYPVFMVPSGFDYQLLKNLGYFVHPLEGGYVGPELATIIYSDRLGHIKEVMLYNPDKVDKHEENIRELMEAGYLTLKNDIIIYG